MPAPAGDTVAIGKVVSPHGLKGELKILPYSGDPSAFAIYKRLVLADTDGAVTEHAVARCRSGKGQAIVQLAGITDRSGAEALVGSEVRLRRVDLPPLAEDEYYWHELVGMEVRTDSGRVVGAVASLFATKAHDVLVVRGGGREYLVPVKKELLLSQDNENRVLVIADLPGLLELND